MMQDDNDDKGPALVFGASGEQGRAVVEGFLEAGYAPVYGFTRKAQDATYLTDALGATLLTGDLQNPDHVRRALLETQAQAIFLVTTTEMPTELGETTGFADASEAEFQVIVEFFQILKECYGKDGLSRHVVFSTRDNVQKVTRQVLEETGEMWIDPLEDGSIVPHYSAKGRGGEYAVEFLKDIPGLELTLITMPFLFSNFLGFFAPLPNEGRTQWSFAACMGDGSNKIDMMGVSDLSAIVRKYSALVCSYESWFACMVRSSSNTIHSFIHSLII
jgi:nucleoside-diphosphate-sugar epimerase